MKYLFIKFLIAFYVGSVIAFQCEKNIPDDLWFIAFLSGLIISSFCSLVHKKIILKEIKNIKTIKSIRGSHYDMETPDDQYGSRKRDNNGIDRK